MPRNKNRIYIAIFERSAGGGHFHTALLHTPKFPAVEPGADKDSRRFRAARVAGDTDGRWQYRDERVQSRSRHVGALVLVGKTVRSAEELGALFQTVSLSKLDDCFSWVVEAVQLLIERDIIEVPVLDLQKLQRRGGALAEAYWRVPEEDRGRMSIPTCNTLGERVESEVKGIPTPPATPAAQAAVATSDVASEDSVWC